MTTFRSTAAPPRQQQYLPLRNSSRNIAGRLPAASRLPRLRMWRSSDRPSAREPPARAGGCCDICAVSSGRPGPGRPNSRSAVRLPRRRRSARTPRGWRLRCTPSLPRAMLSAGLLHPAPGKRGGSAGCCGSGRSARQRCSGPCSGRCAAGEPAPMRRSTSWTEARAERTCTRQWGC